MNDKEKPPERVWIENDPPTSESPLVVTKIDESHKARFTEYVIAPAEDGERADADLLYRMYKTGLALVYHCRGLARTEKIAVTGVEEFDAVLKEYEARARTLLEPKGTKP